MQQGGLAQLAARMLSMHKVAGSIPAISTSDYTFVLSRRPHLAYMPGGKILLFHAWYRYV